MVVARRAGKTHLPFLRRYSIHSRARFRRALKFQGLTLRRQPRVELVLLVGQKWEAGLLLALDGANALPFRIATACASFWTAPVLWRFCMSTPPNPKRQRTAAVQDAPRFPRLDRSCPTGWRKGGAAAPPISAPPQQRPSNITAQQSLARPVLDAAVPRWDTSERESRKCSLHQS